MKVVDCNVLSLPVIPVMSEWIPHAFSLFMIQLSLSESVHVDTHPRDPLTDATFKAFRGIGPRCKSIHTEPFCFHLNWYNGTLCVTSQYITITYFYLLLKYIW